MKKTIIILAGILMVLSEYLAGCFVEVSFNLNDWNEDLRRVVGFSMLITLTIATVIQGIYNHEND